MLAVVNLVLLLISLINMSSPPTPAAPPAPSAAPNRWAAEQQPLPVANPKGSRTQQWYVKAIVGRWGTGNNSGYRIQEKTRNMYAETYDLALIEQQNFINSYLHPQKRQRKAAAEGSSSSSSAAEGSSSTNATTAAEPRPTRAAAPTLGSLVEPPVHMKQPGQARAGRDRGHRYEPARLLREQIEESVRARIEEERAKHPEVLPRADALQQNWLKQIELRERWRTERIEQLEQQVGCCCCCMAFPEPPNPRSPKSRDARDAAPVRVVRASPPLMHHRAVAHTRRTHTPHTHPSSHEPLHHRGSTAHTAAHTAASRALEPRTTPSTLEPRCATSFAALCVLRDTGGAVARHQCLPGSST